MPPFPTTRLASTLTSRRAFSIMSRIRTFARNAEPHPFERYPVTQSIAKADWAKQVRHVGDAALFYFPAFALFLGWPFLAKKMLDGSM